MKFMSTAICITVVTVLASGAVQAANPNAIAATAIPLANGLAVTLQDADVPSCTYRGEVVYTPQSKLLSSGWQIGIREYRCADGQGGTSVRSFAGAAFLKKPAKKGDRLTVTGQFL